MCALIRRTAPRHHGKGVTAVGNAEALPPELTASRPDEGHELATGPSQMLDIRSELLRDELTGLGSMITLRERLERCVDQYPPFGPRPALLLVDIDGFRRLNAMYGAETADEILVATAARLRSFAPGTDSAYRSGADEFVVLLDPTTLTDAVEWARHLQSGLSQPIRIGGIDVGLAVSVAVVMLGHRRRLDALLRDADVTMYRAKAEGGNRVDVYNWEVDSWSTARKRDVERLAKEVEDLRLRNRMLVEAISVDQTTGLPNALAFDADQLQLRARLQRSAEPYAILRARIDDLELIRTRFRTPSTMKAFTQVAHAIRATVRRSERAYVLEEGDFAVLLHRAGLRDAVAAAQRIRARVYEIGAEHPADPSRRLTVTLATLEAGAVPGDTNQVLAELGNLLAGARREPNQIVWRR